MAKSEMWSLTYTRLCKLGRGRVKVDVALELTPSRLRHSYVAKIVQRQDQVNSHACEVTKIYILALLEQNEQLQ